MSANVYVEERMRLSQHPSLGASTFRCAMWGPPLPHLTSLPNQAVSRPGHSVNRTVSVRFFGLWHKFGSLQIGTDRFFINLGTEQNRFRLVRFGFSSDQTNRGFTQAANKRIEKIGKKILKKHNAEILKNVRVWGYEGVSSTFYI